VKKKLFSTCRRRFRVKMGSGLRVQGKTSKEPVQSVVERGEGG